MDSANRLASLSDGELADRFGAVKARGDKAEAEMKACKAEFDARKLDFAKGVKFKVTKDTQSQTRLSVDALRKGVDAELLKPFEQTSARTIYLVRPIEKDAA